ncbi:MAG: hypothetical protein MSA50_02970, partial [Veillonellaceae bacterium]|nr:hypothetical protein [Veillonellaceae bacterium]
NENLQTRVSWDSCTSWPSFETLPTMNALSDYLTKSGREESGGLLGAYGLKQMGIVFRKNMKKAEHV